MTSDIPISERLAGRLRIALAEAVRNKDSRAKTQPQLEQLARAANELKVQIRDTLNLVDELSGGLDSISCREKEELELASDHWDNIAQLATVAERLDDVFFAYDEKLWVHLLNKVEIDIYEGALGKLSKERLLLLFAPLQRTIGRVRDREARRG